MENQFSGKLTLAVGHWQVKKILWLLAIGRWQVKKRAIVKKSQWPMAKVKNILR
jgi:hypothetical protein